MWALSGALVKALTMGTRISPAIMQKAPALMGLWSIFGKELRTKMFRIITTVENAKLTQQAALVARFQYRP